MNRDERTATEPIFDDGARVTTIPRKRPSGKAGVKAATVLLVVAMVCALGGAAGSAFAHKFKFAGDAYPVTVKAANQKYYEQGFELGSASAGIITVCSYSEFEGEATAPSKTLTVHPTYGGACHARWVGRSKYSSANVYTTGCNYVLHAARPETTNGIVDVDCESGKSIEIGIGEWGCDLKLYKGELHRNAGTVEYVEESGKIRTKIKMSPLSGTASECSELSSKQREKGEYGEGIASGGYYSELTGRPAEFFAEGSTGKDEAVDLEVS